MSETGFSKESSWKVMPVTERKLSTARKASLRQRDARAGYLFIAPAVFGLVVFMLYPIIASFSISTYDWGMLTGSTFVGLENYQNLFQDDIFRMALGNTFRWVVTYVPISLLTSFILALFMDMPIRMSGFFRALFYLPVVTPIVVVSLLFTWVYNKEYGILNYLLYSWFGSSAIGWLTDPNLSLFSVALMSVWKWAGYNMLIFLAALKGISESLYEAAEIDGITPWKKLIHIKIPLIMPSIYFVVLTCVIDAFQIFTEVYIMTQGGPGYSTHTVVYYLWASAFRYSKMGYACAIAVVMFAIITIVTVVQNRVLDRHVQYDT